MSYSHQVTIGSPVSSYSGTADPTFDDWASLRLDFQNSMVFVGNTSGLGLGVNTVQPDAPEMNVAQAEQINNGPLDLTGPTIVINSPAPNASVLAGSSLTVSLACTDASGVDHVQFFFDINGNGDTSGPNETVLGTHTTADAYSATFSGISGTPGARSVGVVATDLLGNFQTADSTVSVVSTVHPWHNGPNPFDVNGIDGVTPLDALIIISYINAYGAGALPRPGASPAAPPYVDVSGDDAVAPADVLLVISYINNHPAGSGEGEAVAHTASPPVLIRLPSFDVPLTALLPMVRIQQVGTAAYDSHAWSAAWQPLAPTASAAREFLSASPSITKAKRDSRDGPGAG